MNIALQVLFRLLTLVPALPGIINHVQQVHAGKTGAEKKDAAIALVNDALSVATSVSPGNQQAAAAAAAGAAGVVQTVYDVMKAAGALHQPQVAVAAAH